MVRPTVFGHAPPPSGYSTRTLSCVFYPEAPWPITWTPERRCSFRVEEAIADPAALLEQVEIGPYRLLYAPMPMAPRGESYAERLYRWGAAVRSQMRTLETKHVLLTAWEQLAHGRVYDYDTELRAEAEAAAGPKPQPQSVFGYPVYVDAHVPVRFILSAACQAQAAITISIAEAL